MLITMEQTEFKAKEDGHKAITAVIKDLENLGYQINRIQYHAGHLDIGCYCPQIDWVGLSDTQNKEGKSE